MTHSTAIIQHSGLKYRIEKRQVGDIWQQRHVWYPAPATFVTEETADEWITVRGIASPDHHYQAA